MDGDPFCRYPGLGSKQNSRWCQGSELSKWRSRHLGVKLEQLFEALGIVLETAADGDALQRLVVPFMGLAQVGGHLLGIVKIGDCSGEMGLASQQDVLRATGEVGLVLFGELGAGEGVPVEGVGVAVVGLHFTADGSDPDQMELGGDSFPVVEAGDDAEAAGVGGEVGERL